jgi:glyoxylase I family protein
MINGLEFHFRIDHRTSSEVEANMATGWIDGNIHHIAISVADIDRALRFYRDALGFEVDWDMDHRGGEALARVVGLPDADARMIMLKGYGLRVELFGYYAPPGKQRKPDRQCDFGLTHFAMTVRNIHDVYERLVKRGVTFNCPPQEVRSGVWATYLKDSEGVTIELLQYPENQ